MRQPLYTELVERIIADVEAGVLMPNQKLPAEVELARQYSVSRTTLREALGVLSSEGWIVKAHGVGTFIRPRPHHILETMESYTEAVRKSGYEAEDRVLDVAAYPLPVDVAEAAALETGTTGILVESMRTADGVPVIYCIDYLLPPVIDGKTVEQLRAYRERHESLFGVFEEELGTELAVSVLSVTATAATPAQAEVLDIEPGAPLLLLEGLTRDDSGQPCYYSRNWFRPDHYDFQIVRRKPATAEGRGRFQK